MKPDNLRDPRGNVLEIRTCIINATAKYVSVGRALERRTIKRGDGDSIKPMAASNIGSFVLPTFPWFFLEDTLEAGGVFCLVCKSEDVKDPTQGINV